ncbi:MAG: hypothetical protein SF029_02850 [bacterium]|nr:hypothetical protein [bacterium]
MSDRSTLLTHLNNARASLVLYTGKLEEAKTTYLQCGNTATKLNEAKVLHDAYRQHLQNASNILNSYELSLRDPNTATITDLQQSLVQFGISLTVSSDLTFAQWEIGVGANAGERIREAYKAVYDIVQMLARQLFCADLVLAAIEWSTPSLVE